MFTIRWRPIHSKTKKNQFSVLKCAEETTKKWALTTWWRSSKNHYLEHVAHESFSNQLVPFTYYTTSSKIDEISFFFCWLSVQTFHFMGWKKNEEQVSKFWPRRHHGSPFCYGIVCPHFSKEKPPRKLQIVAYYVGRRTRLWENAVNNSHFEKIISNTDVTRQMLQFQLFIPRKIFCWQHNIQWPTEKVDYSKISITKTWYVNVI